jgi:hypothetical protein
MAVEVSRHSVAGKSPRRSRFESKSLNVGFVEDGGVGICFFSSRDPSVQRDLFCEHLR